MSVMRCGPVIAALLLVLTACSSDSRTSEKEAPAPPSATSPARPVAPPSEEQVERALESIRPGYKTRSCESFPEGMWRCIVQGPPRRSLYGYVVSCQYQFGTPLAGAVPCSSQRMTVHEEIVELLVNPRVRRYGATMVRRLDRETMPVQVPAPEQTTQGAIMARLSATGFHDLSSGRDGDGWYIGYTNGHWQYWIRRFDSASRATSWATSYSECVPTLTVERIVYSACPFRRGDDNEDNGPEVEELSVSDFTLFVKTARHT